MTPVPEYETVTEVVDEPPVATHDKFGSFIKHPGYILKLDNVGKVITTKNLE
jgi:hypothetical protein